MVEDMVVKVERSRSANETVKVSSGCFSEAVKSDVLQTGSGGFSFNYKTVKLEPSQREALHGEETCL
ncbi:unnamed protein product [Pleuronectes platessa]|uniref:Uncharacterized protein n=1 Tax=Pleuronectes platessa TaxID=8262 RepID=A0A9N7YE09_PLEPL|nr:unnamed protein product [Pleuronectes platessa]